MNTFNDITDDIIHIAVKKPFKNKWDVVCKTWLESRISADYVHDGVPTCLFCIGRIDRFLRASSTSSASGRTTSSA